MLLDDSQQCYLWVFFLVLRNGLRLCIELGESPSLIKDGKVIMCKTENHVPVVEVPKEIRIPDVLGRPDTSPRCQIINRSREVLQSDVPSQENPGQASGDRLHFRFVQALGDRPDNAPERVQLSREGLSGNPPDSHNVVVEQPVVGPKEKIADDMRVSSEEETADLPFIADGPRDHTRASQLAGTMFFFF